MKRSIFFLIAFIVLVSYQPDEWLQAQTTGQAVTLSWTPPTENEDNTPLLDLAGYNIYWGTTSGGPYTQSVTVANPGIATYVVEPLTPATWYFVATAYNTAGLESAFSNEASAIVSGVPTRPKAPGGLVAQAN